MPNDPVRLVQPTSRNLLARLLDEPDLPALVQELPAAVLGSLIDRVGLEDAGELVALATTEQLAHVFDEDLWKNERPGEQERFDAARFVVWLEVLLEAGDAFAAQRLSELPEDLLTLALHRHLLVFDVDALAAEMEDAGEDAELTDKALTSCLHEELDSYQLVARSPDGWDTVLAAVLALDRHHHAFLVRVLDRCCAMTAEYIEDNGGLYEVLTSEEMLEGDVAAEREDRRAEAGHVAPEAAKSFLALARTDTSVPPTEHDAVTRAYFRNLRRTTVPARAPARGRRDGSAGSSAGKAQASGLRELLRQEGIVVEQAPPLLPRGSRASAEPLFVRAMRRLAEEAPQRFEERAEELAYLTNVLVAGWSAEGRRLRPVEAARLAIETCSVGLEAALGGDASRGKGDVDALAAKALHGHPADGLFRLGWRLGGGRPPRPR